MVKLLDKLLVELEGVRLGMLRISGCNLKLDQLLVHAEPYLTKKTVAFTSVRNTTIDNPTIAVYNK